MYRSFGDRQFRMHGLGRNSSAHSYNLLFLSATIVAGELAQIECTDSKQVPSWNRFQDGACCGSERTFYGETTAEEIGVRPIPVWWSRGESNPCPKATWKELLRAQFVIYIPLSRREQTPYGIW